MIESSADILKKVKDTQQFRDLLALTKQTNDPALTKKRIVDSLAPFFDNRFNLERFANEALIPELAALAELAKSPTYYPFLQRVLAQYKSAKLSNPSSFYRALGFWYRPCEQALVKYWSVYHLELDKKNLPLPEFVHESFRNIGDIVEGVSQPFLRVLLHITRIASKTSVNPTEIQSLDLGVVISQLIDLTTFPELFVVQPWDISLNQCRNIAFHHSAQVKDNEVICTYGKPPKTKVFSTNRNDIFLASVNIFNVFRVVKLAYSLSVVDNISDLQFPDDDPPFLRKESHLINLVLQFASQGFDVLSFSETEALSTVRVRDSTRRDDKFRAAHSSQFLYNIWLATHSCKVAVEYENADGLLMYRFAIDSDTCERMSKGEEDPWALLGERMTINEAIP
jgi:hypothetical protein